jgi:hypothetical protein
MHEFILANLLFQVGAGTTLVLFASSAAVRELHRRRAVLMQGAAMHDTHTVVELPAAPRAPKLLRHVDLETRSEAA